MFCCVQLDFPDECGDGHHRNMSERSFTVQEFFNRFMCVALDQFVDSNLIDMHGTHNTVKFKGLGFEN